MRKLIGIVVFIVYCGQVNETSQLIQPQELIGTWKVTHTYVSSCIANGDTLPPDTGIDESTYDVFQDSIKICIKQIVRSPCGRVPLPICFPIPHRWLLENDTLLVFPMETSSASLGDTAKYAVSRYAHTMIIFSSGRSIDTCSRQ